MAVHTPPQIIIDLAEYQELNVKANQQQEVRIDTNDEVVMLKECLWAISQAAGDPNLATDYLRSKRIELIINSTSSDPVVSNKVHVRRGR